MPYGFLLHEFIPSYVY